MGATSEQDPPASVTRQMEAEARDDVGEPGGRELLGAGKKANEPRSSCSRVTRTFGRRDEEWTARWSGSRRRLSPFRGA